MGPQASKRVRRGVVETFHSATAIGWKQPVPGGVKAESKHFHFTKSQYNCDWMEQRTRAILDVA